MIGLNEVFADRLDKTKKKFKLLAFQILLTEINIYCFVLNFMFI